MTIGGSDEHIMIQLIEGYRRQLIVRAGKNFNDFREREQVVNEINRVCDALIADIETGVVKIVRDPNWREWIK